jgi:lipopolysaccharide biosynthesis glycosyltransferase
MLLGVLLVFFLPLLMSVPATPKSYAVVSIVDITGVLSCLIKVHSVLKSSQSESRFVFKFLVLNTTDAEGNILQLEQWNSIFAYTFPSVSFESKLWSTPSTMPKLRQKSFEKDYIFSRFYLPEIFADVDLYVYLDNDLVVTADLVELFETPLTVDVFMPTSGPARPAEPVPAAAATSSRLGGAAGALQNQHKFQKLMAQKEEKKRAAKIAEDLKRKPPPSDGFRPCIGFVYERHTDYNRYIEDNFNKTHPLVVETKSLVLSSLFMNGGVALVNASCWRERGMRRQAEELMSLNTIPGEEIYGTGAGDQAVFYLLLQHRVTYLHARWNMRRLPTKTVHMLAHRQMTGKNHKKHLPRCCMVDMYC